MLITPTVFSTLAFVFCPQIIFTASSWAWNRFGEKSPLRIHSELSILKVIPVSRANQLQVNSVRNIHDDYRFERHGGNAATMGVGK
jgi:N-acyl-L-homoserine lactone synthetase